MKMMKKAGFILCALMLTLSLLVISGCDKNPSLKGETIVIGNWFQNYDVNDVQPQTDVEERILEWRTKIQKDYGFKMQEKMIASWGEMPQIAATSIMTGTPAAQVFLLQGNWVISLITQNLAYPVSDSKEFDLYNPQPVAEGMRPPVWNKASLDSFTFGGKIYSFSEGINLNNAQVLFFNKRLFREAGLDPELPYDMQRDGTWTWENFVDICKKLTRDINNDGIIDTYALPQDLTTEILGTILASNNAQFIGRDPVTGHFTNATNTPEFLECLQYAIRLNNEGVMKRAAEGANWDWFKSDFADGLVAMRVDESYVWNELGEAAMKDDWGVVMFPKGPRATGYHVSTRENMMVIPSIYKPAQVDKILWALSLWYTPVDDDWKSSWYRTFRDSRAVDETLEIIRNTDNHIPKNQLFIAGLNVGDIAYEMFWHEGDPAQLIEAVSQDWNAKIKDINDILFQ